MKIIVACDQSWGIGHEGNLLIHLRKDLQRFKAITTGNIVVYGRKTISTFPGEKPLAGRINIILTRNENYQEADAFTVNSVGGLFSLLEKITRDQEQREIYIIGGADVYEQLLPYCSEVLLTEIAADFQADKYFPALDKLEGWIKSEEEDWQTDGEIKFRYLKYFNQRKIELRRFYQNDLKKLRDLGLIGFEGSLKALQQKASKLIEGGKNKIYTLLDRGEPIGLAKLSYPLLNSNLAYFSWLSSHSLSAKDIEKMIDLVLEDNPSLLRLEVISDLEFSAASKEEFMLGETEELARPAYQKTIYAFERSGYAAAFIPFSPFGLIAIKFKTESNKAVIVDFWRQDKKLEDPDLIKAAVMLKIINSWGEPLPIKEAVFLGQGDLSSLKQLTGHIVSFLKGDSGTPRADYEFLAGSDFQKNVWQEIAKIPYGRVATYAQIAEKVAPEGKNHLAYTRAVGSACGANPLPLLIPCHRIIGKNRSLVGFTGGLDIKDHLLNLEMQSAQKILNTGKE